MIVPSVMLAPVIAIIPAAPPTAPLPKELPELTLVTPAVFTSPAALTMKLPVAPPAPTPAAALPPMARDAGVEVRRPAVVVTEIVPALPPRARGQRQGVAAIGMMAMAPGAVIVSAAPVIVRLPAVPDAGAGSGAPPLVAMLPLVVTTLPATLTTMLPPLPLPPAVLIEPVCRLPALLPPRSRRPRRRPARRRCCVQRGGDDIAGNAVGDRDRAGVAPPALASGRAAAASMAPVLTPSVEVIAIGAGAVG